MMKLLLPGISAVAAAALAILAGSAGAQDEAFANSAICARIAELEDAGELQSRRVRVALGDTRDLDGDGRPEILAENIFSIPVENGWELDHQLQPFYPSGYASADGFFDVDGRLVGLTRDLGMLTRAWDLKRSGPEEFFASEVLCHFDREWEEQTDQQCERPPESYDRVSFDANFSECEPISPPTIVEDVYGAWAIEDFKTWQCGIPVDVEFDGDREIERLGLYAFLSPSPSLLLSAVPLTLDAETGEIERTFQNARLLQFVGGELANTVNSTATVEALAMLQSRTGGDIEFERHYDAPSWQAGAADKPLHEIFRVYGTSPQTVCSAEYSWRTVWKTEGSVFDGGR